MKEEKIFEENIISWYPFKKDSEILEITDKLKISLSKLPLSATVTTFEVKKGQELKQFLTSFEFFKKWDYITLLGTFKDAIDYFKNPEQLFIELKKHLKENGKILIATDNKFGISNWISKENKITQSNDFSKKELDNLFDKANFKYIKYYYPLPNYKAVNVIYTDSMLPNIESISRNLTLYKEQEIINGNSTSIYKEIVKNNKNDFTFFANSFFIELGLNNDNNEVKFVSFSNLRKQEYQIQTIIKNHKVIKKAANAEAKAHIQNIKSNIDILKEMDIDTLDSYEEEKIISEYTNESSLDKVILKLLQENKKEECFELIEKFKNVLLNIPLGDCENSIFEKYNIEIEKEKKHKLYFLKHGLWDMIFQNCFIINQKFYFYDQEWYDKNVPLEYILYRSIIYLPNITEYLTTEEWLEKLNIQDFQKEFQQLDSAIQKHVRDEKIWNLHTNFLKVEDLEKSFIKEKNKNDEREKYISIIEQDNKEKQEYIISLEKQRDELIVRLRAREKSS